MTLQFLILFWGISLISITYKILSAILCDRLKPYAKTHIRVYQCGFIPGKSTIDHIFSLRQILKKTHEHQVDTHHIFVDYKAAFNSPIRDCLFLGVWYPSKADKALQYDIEQNCKLCQNRNKPFRAIRHYSRLPTR